MRGKVTCHYQEAGTFGGTSAVLTGPVTKEMNPDNNTGSCVSYGTVTAIRPGSDAFDVAGGALLGSDCAQNFPLDRFEDEAVREFLYYVTSGDIVVR